MKKLTLFIISITLMSISLNTEVNSWIESPLPVHPEKRYDHAMVYDKSQDIIILFGGNDGENRLDDTWIYNLFTNEWTIMNPSASPPARQSHAMVYDDINEKVILYGGYGSGNKILKDIWTYDSIANAWIEVPDTSLPQERIASSFEILDDTWEYKYDKDDSSTDDIDNEPPTLPDNLKAEAISPTQINLIWNSSIDNVGVEGYEIYREGILIGISISTLYSDLGLSPNTTYEYAVAAYDLSGNLSEPGISVIARTFVDDNILPLISDIKVEDITPSSAIISWTTNEETISYIDYGTTTAYELSAKSKNNYVTIHIATISGIAPSTTYHFRVRSRDRSDNQSLSNDNTITSLSPFIQDSSFGPPGDQFPFNNSFPQNNNYNQGEFRQWGCGYIRDSSNNSNNIDKNLFNFIIILSPPIIIKLLSRQYRLLGAEEK